MSVNRPTRFAACLFAVVVTALATVSLEAQSNKWADPYQKGLKAFNAKNFRAAIALFEQAVAADPRSSANKHVEGVFYTDYFPSASRPDFGDAIFPRASTSARRASISDL